MPGAPVDTSCSTAISIAWTPSAASPTTRISGGDERIRTSLVPHDLVVVGHENAHRAVGALGPLTNVHEAETFTPFEMSLSCASSGAMQRAGRLAPVAGQI